MMHNSREALSSRHSSPGRVTRIWLITLVVIEALVMVGLVLSGSLFLPI